MKKIVCLLLALLMLSGCTQNLSLDLFQSQPHPYGPSYYYDQYDFNEKKIYDQIYTALLNHEESVEGICLFKDDETLYDIYLQVLYDHPEIYYVTYKIYYSLSQVYYEIEFDYIYTEEEILEYNEEIDEFTGAYLEFIEEENMSEEEIISFTYDYIIFFNEYNDAATNASNMDAQINYKNAWTIVGGLVDYEIVCAGYAHTFQYLLQKAGIECLYVRGRAVDSDVNHAWNAVKRDDGHYYYYDLTWDDDGFFSYEYTYYGLSYEQMAKTHHFNSSVEHTTSTIYNMNLNY